MIPSQATSFPRVAPKGPYSLRANFQAEASYGDTCLKEGPLPSPRMPGTCRSSSFACMSRSCSDTRPSSCCWPCCWWSTPSPSLSAPTPFLARWDSSLTSDPTDLTGAWASHFPLWASGSSSVHDGWIGCSSRACQC